MRFNASMCGWVFVVMVVVGAGVARAEPRVVIKKQTVLNEDGAWSWFSDERAIVSGQNVFVGSVANRGDRKGDIDIVSWNTATGRQKRTTLHAKLEGDDHNNPALLRRPDGKLLAVYAKHGAGNRIYHRVSRFADDVSMWADERVFVPSESSRITYSNVFHLPGDNSGGDGRGRIHNFFRGHDATFKPSWATSDDGGETWESRGVLIDFPHEFKHRPYVKYASNGHDTIHFVFTEGHPRDYDNGVYHAMFRGGAFYTTDGELIRKHTEGPMTPTTPSRLFSGREDAVAWVHDLHLDKHAQPVVVYSVQKDTTTLPRGHADSGRDHRFRYARWDGTRWRDFEIAHAGPRLYAGEDDYTGGICIDPSNTSRVFYAANVDPFTGAALPGDRYELFVGETPDGGVNWRIKQLTKHSKADQLRPHVPIAGRGSRVLLWLRGTYRSYTDYDLQVIGGLIRE